MTFNKLDDTKAPELVKRLFSIERASYGSTQALINDFVYLKKRLNSIHELPDLYYATLLLLAIKGTNEELFVKYENKTDELTLKHMIPVSCFPSLVG